MVWLIGDISSTQNTHCLRLRSVIYLQEHSRFTQTSTATLIFTNSWSWRHAFNSYSRKSTNRLTAYPQKHQSSDLSSHYTPSLIHFTFREMWATQVESHRIINLGWFYFFEISTTGFHLALIGADYYGQIMKPNLIKGNVTESVAQLSIFGWLIIIQLSCFMQNSTSHHGHPQHWRIAEITHTLLGSRRTTLNSCNQTQQERSIVWTALFWNSYERYSWTISSKVTSHQLSWCTRKFIRKSSSVPQTNTHKIPSRQRLQRKVLCIYGRILQIWPHGADPSTGNIWKTILLSSSPWSIEGRQFND